VQLQSQPPKQQHEDSKQQQQQQQHHHHHHHHRDINIHHSQQRQEVGSAVQAVDRRGLSSLAPIPTVYPQDHPSSLSSSIVANDPSINTQHLISMTNTNLPSVPIPMVQLTNDISNANDIATATVQYNGYPSLVPSVTPTAITTEPSRDQVYKPTPQYTLPINGPLHTVQELPMNITPVFNGVNQNYPGLQVVNQNPPIFLVQNFLTKAECDFLICVAQDCFTSSNVVGQGVGVVSSSRTSSTCYLAREDLPEYLNKVSLLTGKPVEHCELPQVGRYFNSQQYMQHYDAFDLSNEHGRRFAENGGQRTVTVLVYLNDVERGGSTFFPALNLDVQPKKGTALIFFPATIDGYLDQRALHCAKPAIDTKYVSQVWIRQGDYSGIPSKRIFSSAQQASLVQKSLNAAASGINNPDIVIQNSNAFNPLSPESAAYLQHYQSQQRQ